MLSRDWWVVMEVWGWLVLFQGLGGIVKNVSFLGNQQEQLGKWENPSQNTQSLINKGLIDQIGKICKKRS